MDVIEKSKIRIEHWIRHNEDHLREYQSLAGELESVGKDESAQYIQEMAVWITRSNECLHRALKAL